MLLEQTLTLVQETLASLPILTIAIRTLLLFELPVAVLAPVVVVAIVIAVVVIAAAVPVSIAIAITVAFRLLAA